MKILLVEDNPASIENARKQLAGHSLIVATTMFDFLAACKASRGWEDCKIPSDLIVTDVNIPMGDAGVFSVGNYISQTKQIPVGLIVAMIALVKRVPCYIITDSNSHVDPIGLLLDKIPSDHNFLFCQTRPTKLSNNGKDYGEVLDWIKAYHVKGKKQR